MTSTVTNIVILAVLIFSISYLVYSIWKKNKKPKIIMSIKVGEISNKYNKLKKKDKNNAYIK